MKNSALFCFCQAMCLPERTKITKAERNRLKWKKFNYNLSVENPLPPIFVLLIELYDGKDVYEELESCRINPDYTSNIVLRNDLEFYIPQLTNFMVFHCDFAQDKLYHFFERWSKVDLYFAHLYYWYINSLPKNIKQERAQEIIENIIHESIGENSIHLFDNDYDRFFVGLRRKLSPIDYETNFVNINTRRARTNELIKNYKHRKSQLASDLDGMRGSDIELVPYISPFLQGEGTCVSNPFTSTLIFFGDLCFAADEIIKHPRPLKALKELLNTINKALFPSYVYVPFVKESIRNYTVLNLVVEETKIFSTKERAPYYICLEIFRPQKELAYEYTNLFHSKKITEKDEKHESFLEWAKKRLHIGAEKAKTDLYKYHLFTQRSREILEEDFKLSRLDDIVSLPKTLKYLHQSSHQSFPQIDLEDLNCSRPSRNMTISRNEEKEQNSQLLVNLHFDDATLAEPQQTKRFISEDIFGLSLAHQKNKNMPKSEANYSQDNRSVKSSFLNKNISHRKSPLGENWISKLATEPYLLAPLSEEEKFAELSKEFEQESEKGRNEDQSSRVSDIDEYFFGENSVTQAERIRTQSPFGSLKTWRLVHLIVKSGADIKEEQFAIQLIAKFEHIFQLESLKLPLSSYEILSLGDNVGLVEVIKDAITMSKLKEKIYKLNIQTLNDFFVKFYGEEVQKARKQFCRSLAAYSLVCYFLQIKDRHNGNIMLHKGGHIIHIDFGFFLSNSPGKGIEFERKIPFKLLNEYIGVLGGPKSKLFVKFRTLFYKGFVAARQHREQIIILVKMIYSSQSQNFPCFKGGMRAIQDLERRFYPANASEKELKLYCDSLINQSLDNWRAKCYDKYQYYFQGIRY